MVIFRCLNPEKLRVFMYISVNSVRKRISIVLFTQLLKYLHRPIGIEYWNLKLQIFIQPRFQSKVRHPALIAVRA